MGQLNSDAILKNVDLNSARVDVSKADINIITEQEELIKKIEQGLMIGVKINNINFYRVDCVCVYRGADRFMII